MSPAASGSPSPLAGMPAGADVLLAGVAGSQAYGLATATSDVDTLGVFLASPEDLFGLGSVEATKRTYTSHDPDVTVHEVGKFCRLALAANPTVCELLWLNTYTVTSEAGARLVDLRGAFLSERAVRAAYLGYARSQLARISGGSARRRVKAARHAMRLVRSAHHLLTTGVLNVDVSADAEFLFAVGELGERDQEAFAELLGHEIARVDAVRSVLPEQPDVAAVDEFLVDVRRAAYGCTRHG